MKMWDVGFKVGPSGMTKDIYRLLQIRVQLPRPCYQANVSVVGCGGKVRVRRFAMARYVLDVGTESKLDAVYIRVEMSGLQIGALKLRHHVKYSFHTQHSTLPLKNLHTVIQ